jgi:hypothetical protein
MSQENRFNKKPKNDDIMSNQEESKHSRLAAMSGRTISDNKKNINSGTKGKDDDISQKKKPGRPKNTNPSITRNISIDEKTDLKLGLYSKKFKKNSSKVICEAIDLLCDQNFPGIDDIINLMSED